MYCVISAYLCVPLGEHVFIMCLYVFICVYVSMCLSLFVHVYHCLCLFIIFLNVFSAHWKTELQYQEDEKSLRRNSVESSEESGNLPSTVVGSSDVPSPGRSCYRFV